MAVSRALAMVVAVLCVLFHVSAAQQAPCPSPFVTSHFDDASYHTTYTMYGHAIKLTTELLTQPQTVHSVGLQLAPFGDPTLSYNVRLGLYQQRNTTLFVRLAQTDNLIINGSLAASGFNLYAALQSPVQVTAGVYYIARVADETGLQVYGDGGFTQPGQDLFYDELTSLPNLVVRSFAATAVRAAIVGCPLDGGVAGDPTFYGFRGQVYQVHGIAGYLFNLLTSSDLQVNARFDFIDEASKSITQTEQANLRRTHSDLPSTPAWSHAGTYLGLVGVRLGASSLRITPGAYMSGFKSVTLDGQAVAAGTAYPSVILSTSTATVTMVSPSILRVVTSLLRFDVVNSDGFVNVQRAQLLSTSSATAERLDGILGQSADASRWFPAYGADVDATADVRGEWQQAQIHDFLIVDGDILSTDFERNMFRQ